MTARNGTGPPKVLALRALKLGDLLVAVPALRALRRHWPRHRIMLATSAAQTPIVELIGAVHDVVATKGLAPLGWAAQRPDVAVNLHGAGPNSCSVLDAVHPRQRVGHGGHGWEGPPWLDGIHERLRWCRMLMAHGVPADPDDLYLRQPDIPSAEPGAVLVHPGAAHGSRRWPVPRFAEVARALAEAGERVVITGSQDDRQRAEQIADLARLDHSAVLAGKTGLTELAALVAHACLVISGDTGIAHLSYAYRTPSVVLFGPVPAASWGPPKNGPHVALSIDVLRHGKPFAEEPDPALLGVEVPDVLAAARSVL